MHPVDESRYSRQIKLPQIGEAGQVKFDNARVLILGMGGLGSPAALYLAAAGIGTLVICDYDVVEESNLQRQIIHAQKSIGELKTTSAAKAIKRNNPHTQVISIDHAMQDNELAEQVALADVVLDCTDNFASRFAVNRHCVSCGKPLVSAAAIRMSGQIMSYLPDYDGPCYQCIYSPEYETAMTCESEGVLGPVVGLMGTMQALHALLILLGETAAIEGKLILFDGFNMMWQEVNIPRKPQCPCCSEDVKKMD